MNETSQDEISPPMIDLAWSAWIALRDATSPTLPIPDACPGPDGELLYTWDREEHHFEAEVFPSGAVEFFYRNRLTDELWEHDGMIDDPIPESVIAKMSLFIDA